MTRADPYGDWQAVLHAPRSRVFVGHTSDTAFDRRSGAYLQPSDEALFTQSNVRVLIAQAADGTFRLIALPTRIFPAPTAETELGLGPGIYYRFDVAMYAGDLAYAISLDGEDALIDLAATDRENTTVYADRFVPLTTTRVGDIEVALVSVAPVALDAATAPLSPAPLPGPAGALYVLHLRNDGSRFMSGRVRLRANDLLVGHDEDATPAMRAQKRPDVDLRQGTLILSRPEGSVGIHLHRGTWTRLEAPFEAERTFSLEPGEELAIETHVAAGATHGEVLPVIFELHRRDALEWLNLTAAFWRSRTGDLTVGAAGSDALDGAADLAEFSRDLYLRSLFDQLDCIQTDAAGNVIAHWQGAPSAGYGLVWGIDVEPTAVSLVHLCPELTRQVALFFATRSRVPRGTLDHSVPILVGPLIITRQWLQVTGDIESLVRRPEHLKALAGIVDDLLTLKAPGEMLFRTRYSSDGSVGRRYDYGTNIKVQYALDSYAEILRLLGRSNEAASFAEMAAGVRGAIERTMVVEGPFGPQYSGGTNLGEAPGPLHLPDGVSYYDGEDTSSMLAPMWGACDPGHPAWVNYHRFARSLWCPNYDPEMDVLRWAPSEHGVFAGSAFFSRLAGSVTRGEMAEGLAVLRTMGVDDATGSVHWWPHGVEYRRSQSRCSQGHGAWAWQYLARWLGLEVDANARILTVAPRGLLSEVTWVGFATGQNRFDVLWSEGDVASSARIVNHNTEAWTIRFGFRPTGSGADGQLTWQTKRIESGGEQTFSRTSDADRAAVPDPGFVRASIYAREVEAFGDAEGVLFRRFGPALLWGHWQADRQFDPAAMPFSLRFLVHNGTGVDWMDVSVALMCPIGWTGQARAATHWTPDDELRGGTLVLGLGRMKSRARAIAPFWIRGPEPYPVRHPWLGDSHGLHEDTQPGPHLTIRTPVVARARVWSFEAQLLATTPDGHALRQWLHVPVEVVPEG